MEVPIFMKKNKGFVIIIIGILIAISYIFFVKMDIMNSATNKTYISADKYFKVKNNEYALLYNYELQSAKAIEYDGNCYLPLNWVGSILNDRFYWDEKDKLLIYTLPDEILYSNYDTLGNNNKRLLIKKGKEVYILASVVATYTNITYNIYTDNGANRIFINDKFDDFYKASIRYRSSLRVEKTKKSQIVKKLNRNETISIVADNINDIEFNNKELKWLKVATDDGYIGYIKKSKLKNFYKTRLKSDFKAVEYPNISLDKKIVMAWHQVTALKANNSLESLLDNAKEVNVISPTWFSLSNNQGEYKSLASKAYVDKAHKRGIYVWALIDNFNKDINSFEILSNMQARKKLISSLISDAKNLGLDGINLDFENLNKKTVRHYIQFIRELSVSMRKNGLVLSIDNPNYANFNKYYKRDKQAEVADYIVNMAYDEHYAGSEKGSTSSISFVKSGIDLSLNEVPKEKLINAIPTYTRLWTDNSSKAMGIKAAKQWLEENNIEPVWKDDEGQYYAQATIDDKNYYIWLEEERSLTLKLGYIKNKSLAGVAIWKLGLEPDSVWQIFDNF